MINRRDFVIGSAAALGSMAFRPLNFFNADFPVVRTPLAQRKFTDDTVEAVISRIKGKCADKELAWLFENCFPNTLDTTVDYTVTHGRPDTFVITGDIDAMWLRDSTAQVWPYLPLCHLSEKLKSLLTGVVNRQVDCINFDPYANAFYKTAKVGEWASDHTDMKPGIHERKWEIDSLCYPVRLSYHLWKETGDAGLFTAEWLRAANAIYKTFTEQQRLNDRGPYRFGRTTSWSTDTVPGNGYGNATRPNGLIHSIFRPSDDATLYPFLIPANFFAVVSLRQMAEILTGVYGEKELAGKCQALARQVEEAIYKVAVIKHAAFGDIFAMEVDGFGNALFQDDANVPNLLGLPYLGALRSSDPIYKRTRKFILSESNPYFFRGKEAEGIGSPHTLINQIWPIGVIMRAMTSDADDEILRQLRILKRTHGGTGFMHESFDKDDSSKFTRKWFAWANTLFGELILKIEKERPHLLKVVL
ncbi:glycoside hydrolase family 125 protein [Leadbetterella sp. DM7]|uniref:glycoside hydrolase family 125 protein n=1 Tax=Leadbetterella sp. DM7 TaxID=3235085 RepID=UPI00349E75F6